MLLQKTVFVSYRRTDLPLALLVFKDLTQHGFDVFIDYEGIAAGDFEQTIVENIRSRAHFVVVLTPDALRRCGEPNDWLRREIEAAMRSRRNVVPLLFDGFRFSSASVAPYLSGELATLPQYNGVEVPWMYFDAAMARLRDAFLGKPLDMILHPVSPAAQQAAETQHAAAAAVAETVEPTHGIGVPDALVTRAAEAIQRSRPGPPQDDLVERGATRTGAAAGTRPNAPARSVAVLAGLAGLAAAGTSVVWWSGRHHAEEQVTTTTTTTTPAPAAVPAPETSPPPAPVDPSEGARAAYQRGEDFYYGDNGAVRSEAAAVDWYRKAAELGHPDAQFSLGILYLDGRGGLARSDAEAVAWFRKSAGQGSASGQASLGYMYEFGRGGLDKNGVEAAKWYRKAADQGYADAQSNLAVLYLDGAGGLTKNAREAAKWFRKAADQGNANAQFELARLYEGGRGGLPASSDDALSWYRKAAAQGDGNALAAVKRLTGAH